MVNWKTITPAELKNLKVITIFGKHNHAKYVALLEGGIVKKIYNDTPTNRDHFKREVKFLTYLKNYKYVSRLVHADKASLTLYVTYCGTTPPNTPEYLEKIRKRARHLHKTMGFVRREVDGSIVHNIFRHNTGILNNKIYFFDFGGEKWHIEPIPNKKLSDNSSKPSKISNDPSKPIKISKPPKPSTIKVLSKPLEKNIKENKLVNKPYKPRNIYTNKKIKYQT
jgi:hypothetical protein